MKDQLQGTTTVSVDSFFSPLLLILRSWSKSWTSYIRGNVVSQHAVRLIVQFMAANCGRSTTMDDEIVDSTEKESVPKFSASNSVSVSRLHTILKDMCTQNTTLDGDDTSESTVKARKRPLNGYLASSNEAIRLLSRDMEVFIHCNDLRGQNCSGLLVYLYRVRKAAISNDRPSSLQ